MKKKVKKMGDTNNWKLGIQGPGPGGWTWQPPGVRPDRPAWRSSASSPRPTASLWATGGVSAQGEK